MIAKHQIWNYGDNAKVWVGKYRNSHNLLHWHYDCEIAYVEKGCIDIFCEKRRYRLTEGQAFFADSGQMHYQRASDPNTVLRLFVFDSSVIPSALMRHQLLSPLLAKRYDFSAIYDKLHAVLTEKKPFYGEEAATMIAGLMIDIFRQEQLVPRQSNDKRAQTFKGLLDEVEEKFGEYTFMDAVNYMGMSDAYFSRYFKAATGTTFSQYLNNIRVNNAVRMLQQQPDAPMTEVAERCGFATIRNFNRIFKELTGFAPTKLPRNFSLEDGFAHQSDQLFNPTLYDCEMIESSH